MIRAFQYYRFICNKFVQMMSIETFFLRISFLLFTRFLSSLLSQDSAPNCGTICNICAHKQINFSICLIYTKPEPEHIRIVSVNEWIPMLYAKIIMWRFARGFCLSHLYWRMVIYSNTPSIKCVVSILCS